MSDPVKRNKTIVWDKEASELTRGHQLFTVRIMAGRADPVCVEDIEKYAHETLPRNALDYYRSGANEQVTLQDNRAAFRRWDIQ